MHAAVHLGDFTEERTVLLAAMPVEEGADVLLRWITVLADPFRPDGGSYWSLVLGRFGDAGFEEVRALPFRDGFTGTPQRVDFTPAIPFRSGEVLAVVVRPTGAEVAPLSGVSVVLMAGRSEARVR